MFKKSLGAIGVSILAMSGCGGDSPQGPAASTVMSEVVVHAPQRIVLPTNTMTFSGPRSAYKVVNTGTGFTIMGSSGSTTTTGSTIENLKFSDMTVTLTIGVKAASIPAADLQTLMELYVAFFNRVPDAEGLAYWIDQFKAGMGIDTIADSFYNAAVQYTSLTGYSASMTNADFVRVVYKNVLGRSGPTAPPEADVQWWANELTTGHATKGSLVKTMLGSAHSFKGDATWGWVANLLDNKVSVAKTFAVEQGLNFNTSEASIANTMAIVAAITPISTGTSYAVDPGMSLAPVAPTTGSINLVKLAGCPLATSVQTPDFYSCMTGSITGTTTFGSNNCTLSVSRSGTISLSAGLIKRIAVYPYDFAIYNKVQYQSAENFFLLAQAGDIQIQAISPAYAALTGGAYKSGIQVDARKGVDGAALSCNFPL